MEEDTVVSPSLATATIQVSGEEEAEPRRPPLRQEGGQLDWNLVCDKGRGQHDMQGCPCHPAAHSFCPCAPTPLPTEGVPASVLQCPLPSLLTTQGVHAGSAPTPSLQPPLPRAPCPAATVAPPRPVPSTAAQGKLFRPGQARRTGWG